MITEWFLSLAGGFITWLIGLFPPATAVPDWITSAAGYVQNVINSGAGLGAWIPWPLVIGVGGFQLALWFGLWSVKVIRWLVGLIPTMGGG
ncbi:MULTISPECIES: hypothetical protein [unclassified Leifsonia]|uniref:hypothetical protein n=1 Tax=unclassified Leifsonia TaxID=2663824 RepID=UPI0008A7BF77|nr:MULTISPECIES: hypothetical protein [unclassified Leifsonia]SEH84155.1 hypothetical protein SAMN04515694_10541 [Leifsonia sp. CL154]SFL46822.1 hypothetical protein SAMN04515692_10540 [Leifsonia sp. CL147]